MMISLKCAFLVLLVWTESAGGLASGDCRCKLGSNKRIVGGQLAPPSYIPWHIALYFNDSFICGGFIVNEDYVATAAVSICWALPVRRENRWTTNLTL